MAKKRKPRSKSSGRSSRGRGQTQAPWEVPDPRALEAIMWRSTPQPGPLGQAQELAYQACGKRDPAERVRLAREALEISPDCADAYVLLAEQAASTREELEFYRQGLAAAERALGESLPRYVGQFWMCLETRPYMRARLGVALCLWVLGSPEEAVGHWQEMLRLNPDDNQGIRFRLAAGLLELGRDEQAERLLQEHADESAAWLYIRALLAFRRQGDQPATRQLLHQAAQSNPYVPAYLLGEEPVPSALPGYYRPGEPSEAVWYAALFRRAWRAAPGGLSWLREVLKVSAPAAGNPQQQTWQQLMREVAELPEEPKEVWQVDAGRVAEPGRSAGTPALDWLFLVVDPQHKTPIHLDLTATRPSAEDLWERLLESMLEPKLGPPRRPGKIQVRQKTRWKAWQGKLKTLGIECVQSDQWQAWETIFAMIADQVRKVDAMQHAPGARDLSEVPQRAGHVWQVDMRQLPTWNYDQDVPRRPWCVLVVQASEELVLAQHLQAEPPSPNQLWQLVSQAMQQPMVGQPHRPGTVEVASQQIRDLLQPRLEPLAVRCVLAPELKQLESVLDAMVDYLSGKQDGAAMVEVPGVTLEQLASFFQAAADFYRRAPWRSVGWELPIKVESPKFHSGPWYATVMGQSGMTMGLTLYEDLALLSRLLTRKISSEQHGRQGSALAITYEEAFETHPRDLHAIEKYGWPVAAPEAYPWVVRLNPGPAMRPPLAWELELLEGCLRALPDFTQQPQQQRVQVPIWSGTLEIIFSWESSVTG